MCRKTSTQDLNKNQTKFPYKKKQNLNKNLYHIYSQNAKDWGNLWTHNEESTNQNLKIEIKLNILLYTKKNTNPQNYNTTQYINTTITFFKRVNDQANITFNNDGLALLNKGLKYNLHYK
jgi:type IV secretory pathway VirB6-like protein